MSANGEAPFFNAPELTQRDGTLSAVPGEVFADPVSGLVTTDPEPRTAVANGQEPPAIPVAGPVPHDEEAVRRMVEETLREDDTKAPEAIPPAGTTSTVGGGAAPPMGLLPRQRNRRRTWPNRPPLQRPLRRKPPVDAGDDFDEDLEVVPVKRRRLPAMSMPAFNRPSSSAAGVMLAVVLLIVFGFVAIELVSSLVSSVTGLFD
ncbi:hypothetical protein SAMN05421837_104593 [Amycolatopsis pretoriensis]|uniref:Uncharacterized protein n=2 Tax=Amycolatopsis pretoriensis TaxID=218821 RepID=A0A1H5QV70_9PSEU|nr:hypothetical protein SAMN05421837_104593 [Amycolatopsis pretoriensis]